MALTTLAGSVEAHALAPTRALGMRAHAALTLHGADAARLPALHAAFSKSLACVSVIRSPRPNQLGNLASAVELFLHHCAEAFTRAAPAYDAVRATRGSVARPPVACRPSLRRPSPPAACSSIADRPPAIDR